MTLDQQLVAQLVINENIRFFADAPDDTVARFLPSFRPAGHGGRPTYLALSGGGENGAFGAGLLVGWSQSGRRPDFDLVTGISAGALIAPFAFAGSETDADLEELFTSGVAASLNGQRSLLSGLFGESVLNVAPLRALIDEYVDADLLDRIAARHRAGARLLVVTTNIDAERNVVWDMGAIATSGHPDAMKLFADVLTASASIPGAFPPVPISVLTDEEAYNELHVDGGAIRQIYFFPDAFFRYPNWTGLSGARPVYYAIVNNEVPPRFEPVENRAISVAEQSYRSLIKSNITQSLDRISTFARDNGMEFRMAFIDTVIPSNPKLQFDPDFMRSAFAFGAQKGRAESWRTDVPIGTALLEAPPL